MNSPAFRFYPSDFWGSPDVQTMDLHEVGAYLSLLSASWLSDQPGYLVDDDEKLRRWARMTREQWEQSRDTLLSKFPVHMPGVRINPRLYRESEKQKTFSASQAEKGRKGGRPKAGEKPGLLEQKPGLSSGKAHEKPSVSVSVSASASAAASAAAAESAETNTRPAAAASETEKWMTSWNENCGPLARIMKLTDDRQRKILTLTAKGVQLERFVEATQIATRTPFLRGEGARGWKCTFDYLVKSEANICRALEGAHGEPDPQKKKYVDVTDGPEAENWLMGAVHA